MDFGKFVKRLFDREVPNVRKRISRTQVASPVVEALEQRLVLFVATGNVWPNPQMITLSFQPDGTNLGGVNSNLNQAFNRNSSLNGRWQQEIIRAAQTWASVTNINFVVTNDSGAASGSGKYQQGDPAFGDIRIGGYNFGNSSLARAYTAPQDNNYSVAGDIVFNTGVAYGIGNGFDLYSVALHEIGHALGLDHTSVTSASVMWSSYNGIKYNLHADDVAGIRSIYSGSSGRSEDAYDTKRSNDQINSATDISREMAKGPSSAVISGLDITTTSDVDFYSFSVPKWSDRSISVAVQSSGLSLLAPKLTVYAADKRTVVGTVSGAGQYGTSLSVQLNGVSTGDTFYVRVESAENSVYGVGNYGLTLDLGAKSTPTVSSPKTTTANGSKLSGKGGAAEDSGTHDVLFSPAPVIQTVTPDNGASSMDRTTNTGDIVLNGVAGLAESVEIYQNGVYLGSTISLLGAWSFSVPRNLADGNYDFFVMSKGLLGLGGYTGTSDLFTVTIDTAPPAAPVINAVNPTPGVGGLMTEPPASLSGSAGGSNIITVYDNGAVIGTVHADGFGRWTYNFDSQLTDGTHRFTATATNQAGNTSSPAVEQIIKLDTSITTPTIVAVSPDTGSSGNDLRTQARNLLLQGTGEVDSVVTLYANGSAIGTTTVSSNGVWVFDYRQVTLEDGVYRFTARAVDAADHISDLSDALTVTVDGTAEPAGVSAINRTTLLLGLGQTMSLQGFAEASSQVQVYVNGSWLTTVMADAGGQWSYQYTSLLSSNGTFRYSVMTTDSAGNVSGMSPSYDLVIGSSAPTVSNISLNSSSSWSPSGPVVNTPTPLVSGTASRATTVLIYDNNRLLGTAAVVNSRWSFTTPVLSAGRHSLVAVPVAADGVSRGTASGVLAFQI